MCQRGVCYNTIKTYYLPKNHTISLRIYKAEHEAPTTQILARTTGETITVKNDAYIEKKVILYYTRVGFESASILVGCLKTLKEGENAGKFFRGIIKDFLKDALKRILGG